MKSYDPLMAPEPEAWLALEEDERIRLVEEHHRRARVRLPRTAAHAASHVIVENQAAMGDATPVRRTLERLQAEGLDRHDAIHAVGSVLVEHLHDLSRKGRVEGEPNERYFRALERLTAKKWRRAR